ncbi:hypothetical protein FJ365_03615 [Candidatus Dependentiae bacterium]|nr:hypothetical protein [Candidatus Dependentiae bacterium]
MNKRLIPGYLLFFLPVLLLVSAYVLYQVMRHGLEVGLFVTFLSWAVYILCVPAAHGRLLVGSGFKMLTGQSFFPEPYVWVLAVAVNIMTIVFAPQIYTHTLMTYIFYRAVFIPSYWIIFVLAAIGTWYRSIIGSNAYSASPGTHTAVRHMLTLVGLLVLFYLTHQDFIVLLNVTLSG